VIDVSKATRYIAVASFSDDVRREWDGTGFSLPPLEYRDYALLKVLYLLRQPSKATKYHVHSFAAQKESVTELDFSKLKSEDVIFIVGHGNQSGLYALGPNAKKGGERLIEILTKDGNLKRLRKDKKITIVLLSCRAGLGLYNGVAKWLFDKISIQIVVGGAQGFTFGSIRTGMVALNEVLIRGIPWRMEYEKSIEVADAERETSKREGKDITMSAKQNEIAAFLDAKRSIEDDFKAIALNLSSTDLDKALNEIEAKHRSDWLALCRTQFKLYGVAKARSNLEFDMWYDLITEGYFWADSGKISTAQANAVFTGTLSPTDGVLTSIR
jgi:hypothetical protein